MGKFISPEGVQLGSLRINWWGVALLVVTFLVGWQLFIIAIIYLIILWFVSQRIKPNE